jgi:hypothetical protein
MMSPSVSAIADRPCTDLEKRIGECPASGIIRDGYVELSDSDTTTTGSGNNTGGTSGGTPSTTPDSAPCPVGTFGCDPRDDYRVTVVTLADIARFRPAPGIQRMEPDGWVVVGLPANVYSIVGTQIVAGELLGQSADVRFTPVAWQWNYGDGTAATLPTRGGTWAALGLREFDATPTSHIYQRAGSYTIRLSIVYRAEYRIAGGPFTPIAGTITLPANELHITASGAKTVLVDRDCTVAPRGPGC